MKRLYFIAIVCMLFTGANAQVFIPIKTRSNLLLLQTNDQGRLTIAYHGRDFLKEADYAKATHSYDMWVENPGLVNSPYTPAGVWAYREPALAVVHQDGNTSLDLFYRSHSTSSTQDGAVLTTIEMADNAYPVHVTLFYKAWPENDVVEQWSVIKNNEKGTIRLNKYASANLFLNDGNFELISYEGTWGREVMPKKTNLSQGVHVIESKLGTRQNLYGSQNFILGMGGPVKETEGKVMLGQLAWNGNYKIEFESDMFNNLRIVAGINPYQSEYELKAGQSFETPRFIYTISNEGTGLASRNLHTWLRDHQLADGNGGRLTLLNNWEATYFNFDEKKIASLFKGAKELGVDMFLLDDGWFGNKYPRNADNAGLGDWQENKQKLPSGVGYLVTEAGNNGIKFGIWVEPEMVNPKSELYEKHKDWVIRQPQRPEIYFRNQLVLDLCNPAVQQHVFDVIDNLLTKNPKLGFFKWDCNSPINNAYSAYLAKMKLPQSHLYVEYVKGLYKVLERVRAKYPTVPMMLCSGGGGRSDYSLLKYFTEFWPSDNTEPIERIFIQWENSYFYPGKTVCNHVTMWGKQPMKFKADVAAMGKMGFDIDVAHVDPQELEQAKVSLKDYDGYKQIVWNGDIYRLVSPYESDFASLMYVMPDKSKAVMFNYLTTNRYMSTASTRPVRLSGLDGNKNYKITEVSIVDKTKSVAKGDVVYSGSFLLNVGFNPAIKSSRASAVFVIEEAWN